MTRWEAAALSAETRCGPPPHGAPCVLAHRLLSGPEPRSESLDGLVGQSIWLTLFYLRRHAGRCEGMAATQGRRAARVMGADASLAV